MVFKGEKIFKREKEVKYLFHKPYRNTDKLIIVFSAFSAIGKGPRYNYINTLEDFDCNKLFILDDFGSRASYYLCENRDFSIERSVYQLIQAIIKEYNIKNTMACGSSKGGYAALYYGLKYGFDHIIVASPQYFIGDYILKQTNSEDVARFMSGSDNVKDKKFLNDIMPDIISQTTYKPNVFIHLGEREYHYKSHVLPLLSKLDEFNIEYQLDLGDYDDHQEVIKYYPGILKEKVMEIFEFPPLKFDMDLSEEIKLHSIHTIKAVTNSEENKIAWYLYRDGRKIKTKNYSYERNFMVTFNNPGVYRIKAFTINKLGHKTSITTKKIKVS
ncbi:hypothetical protein M948_05965 [Virgibacillus sp. CM-4]|uniref:YqiA/YcfP family alpha/beta fold hydrolase n=1 Tax=Virgibacillus sp. CM-4 TaxID=1354277 RepID=UPI000388434D|nr:YqiA/YcfP family alpha/beta fold hydrolase [Virgibacillus sp. CM-4]EQB38118.1 hypothetical protein M948_05965 [Virgibacillus sp. CM-4]